jgi:DinB family protein
MLTPDQRRILIDKIRALPDQLAKLTENLSHEQLTTPYLHGEWTVAQNVHHLADSHMNSYIRCKLMATEDHPALKPYDQDRWATFSDAQSAEIAISLALLRSLHTRWVEFWEQLPDDAWARSGFHPESGPITLADQLRIYAAHGEGHIDQINRTLAARHG